MKHSQLIGNIAAVSILCICFFPWSYIPSAQVTVSGFHAEGTSFGKPGVLNCLLCLVAIVLFSIPAIWAKRTNVFIAALNLAWAFRNYLLLSFCMMGECPEKKIALYGLMGISIVMLVMTFLPKIDIKKTDPTGY